MVAAMDWRIRKRVVDACIPQAIGIRVGCVLCGQVDAVIGGDGNLCIPRAEGRAREHGGGGHGCESEDGGDELHLELFGDEAD